MRVAGYARVPGGGGKRAATSATRRFSLRPRTFSVGSGERRSVPVRFENNRRSLKKINGLLRSVSKRARRGARAYLVVQATDSGGTAARLKRRVKLVPAK